MFSKFSRYRKLPDEVIADAQGRTLPSKALRLLPQVSGDFYHTVEEIDRLDHLAFKYYQQPTKWWRICDANPDFMSPLALLGKGPVVTDRFPLTWDDTAGQPPWAEARRHLITTVGVLDVHVVERVAPVSTERTLVVTYNRMNVSTEELEAVIAAEGFEVGQPENIGRIGKPIVIPPNVVT